MIDPITALTYLALSVVGLVAIFWPRYGLVARWRRHDEHSHRVMIEDSLKHLHDYEYRKLSCTIQSIAGVLAIPADKATIVVERMEAKGLLKSYPDGLQLTPDGRSYALRVIRVHRLWERYLADETSVPEIAWHKEAELKEHRMTPDEAEVLSRQMGHPRFDPHGDPIPTSAGEIPALNWIPLNSLKNGEIAQIVHIEDEPQAVYAQLVAQGLYPGMQVRVIDVSSDRIRFEADGEECVLAPVFISNISVVPFGKHADPHLSFVTLSSLEQGGEARVLGIARSCRGQQRRRLMDLGVVPGSRITAVLESISGDPVAYTIRGATIALRKQQSNMIYIEKNKDGIP